MIHFAALLLAAQAATPPPAVPMMFVQVIVRNQIVIRTIRIGPPNVNTSVSIEWKEGRGPKCVPVQSISGAAHIGQRSVDLLLRNGSRLRARLASSCPALDYYNGFYLTPGEDGMVCADREFIRSRAGGQCEIDGFRSLKAVQKRKEDER